MPNLTAQQLTGRTRSHVIDLAVPRCTLHPDAAQAFLTMRMAASQAGMNLIPVSTFRDFERQVAIWNDKFAGRRPLLDRHGQPLDRASLSDEATIEAILNWSALPGASRHHWGTELDVIDAAALPAGYEAQLTPQEFSSSGPFDRLNDWLTLHAEDFGFFRPYDADRGGVQPEPWHLSYAPIAAAALPALTVEVMQLALQRVSLNGSEVVLKQLPGIHARYVAAVAPISARAFSARLVAPGKQTTLSPATRPS
jgi:LAS superfamily LD-carboxypeptidase LdcB